jgi:hypothetical protein
MPRPDLSCKASTLQSVLLSTSAYAAAFSAASSSSSIVHKPAQVYLGVVGAMGVLVPRRWCQNDAQQHFTNEDAILTTTSVLLSVTPHSTQHLLDVGLGPGLVAPLGDGFGANLGLELTWVWSQSASPYELRASEKSATTL